MLSTGQHTLTTQPDSDEPYKHCILVKLTDSSARAIEDFLKNKVKHHSFLFHQYLKSVSKTCFKFQEQYQP